MRKYSFIFSELVEGESDMIGLLAYSIYKKQKIEYIEKFVRDNNRDPTEEELDRFHQFTRSDSQIQQYNSTAENDLNAFVNDLMSTKLDEVEGFYRTAFRDAVKESGHGYWYAVWQGVVSSVLYTLILGLIVVLLWSTQAGPKEVIERMFKVKITTDTTSIKSP